jgi:hypothetical protein
LENGEITQFYFKKLKELEISLALVIVINIYLIIVSVSYHPSRPTNTSPAALPNLLKHCKYAYIFLFFALVLQVPNSLSSNPANDANTDSVAFIKRAKANILKGNTVLEQEDSIFASRLDHSNTTAIPLPYIDSNQH